MSLELLIDDLRNHYPEEIARWLVGKAREVPIESAVHYLDFFTDSKTVSVVNQYRALYESPKRDELLHKLVHFVGHDICLARDVVDFLRDKGKDTHNILANLEAMADINAKITRYFLSVISKYSYETTKDIASHVSVAASHLGSNNSAQIGRIVDLFDDENVVNVLNACAKSPEHRQKVISNLVSISDNSSQSPKSFLVSLKALISDFYQSLSGHKECDGKARIIEAKNYARLSVQKQEHLDTTQKIFFEELPVEQLDFGSQELVQLFVYNAVSKAKSFEKIVRYSQNFLIPAIQIICELHREKKHPTLGTELGLDVTKSRAQARSAGFVLYEMENVSRPHNVTRTAFDASNRDVLEIRTLPSYYPVLKLELDYMLKAGLLAEGMYLYHTSIGNSLQSADSILLLMASLCFLPARFLSSALKTKAKNNEGLGFPGIYCGQTIGEDGEIASDNSQTNIFGGMFAVDAHKKLFGDYEHNFVRNGLLGAAKLSGAKLLDEAYADFREAFCGCLYASGLDEVDTLTVVGDAYSVERTNYPIDNKHIRRATHLLLKAGAKDNFKSLKTIVDTYVYGSDEDTMTGKKSFARTAYDDVEMLCIGTFMSRRFKGVIEGLKQASYNQDYKDSAEKLLSYSAKPL